ncbi:sensor histidine kinase [Litchfieldella xinjiangensis]|uniref:sensor histidine kinase n=1 Tax=Litchfieldella xinjiangensis TaxID=1166948 RepID=UPI000694F46C|nr:ATP-binding protein [Halomonas xinjiangensis]
MSHLVTAILALLAMLSTWQWVRAHRRHRQLAEAQAHLERQLQEAQKLAALGRLTGGIAHDFNNLLTVIIGNAELLSEGLERHSPLRQPAELMLHAGERGRELTQRLLGFARRQTLAPERVDVNALLKACRSILTTSLGEAVDLELHLAPSLAQAYVDAAQLESAILNLAVNARDAMPDGGRLQVATSNAAVSEEGLSRAPQLRPGRYVRIVVSDTGQGMSDAVRRQLFEPFFTTKEGDKGTGLGMSMVATFIRQSGGHVAVFSEPREGTRVHLYVPCRAPEAPEPDETVTDVTARDAS